MSSEEQDQFELLKAEQFVEETPRLDGIASIRIRLDEDWSGDPAMYLTFTLRQDQAATRGWIRAFNRYAGIIETKILHSGLRRFPYTEMSRAA